MIHLAERFVGFLRATPLTPSEQLEVSRILPPRLRALFYRQRFEDQRHAFDVALRVPDDPLLKQAALLHDVGKIDAHLGALGRTFATLWGLTSLPVWGRWRTYLAHPAIGAAILEAHGAAPTTVAFTRHHPGPPPPGFDPVAWETLAAADES